MTDKQDFVSGNIDYHKTLSPLAWEDNKLRSEVQLKLLEIARAFVGYLDIPNFKIEDIVLTGSMANYNYTKFSDFDVHVVTNYSDLECDDIAEAFYRAKKEIWNNEHDIKVRGHDAELYVEDTATPPVSGGMYSILSDEWITEPEYDPPKVNNTAVNAKVRDLIKQIEHAIDGDAQDVERLRTKIRNMRKAGLADGGEFGVENLAFKVLRNEGYLDKLQKAQTQKIDKELSLESAEKVFTADQVLAYIKKVHDNFHVDHAIDTHPQWVLKMLPVDNLKGPSEDDPYDRHFNIDQDHVASITQDEIKSRAIVVDKEGWIIDGNHRHAAAKQYGMSHMPAFIPHKGINEDVVNEAATSILYHFASIRSALSILSSKHFELSSVTGNRSEEQYAPKDHPYFLSLTRTRVGDYHRYVGTGGVLFVLDGTWFNRNHKVTPIDYWERAWQHSPDRSREAEDRVFSKTPTIPIDSVQEVHVLLKEQDKWRSPEARQLMIAAKKSGIATYFYVDEKNWRLLNKAKSISVKDAGGVLGGQMPTKPMYSPERDYLEPWLELIYKNSKADLSDRAEKTRHNLVYYGSRYRDEDSGLGGDLSNARKPDQGASRRSAIKIIDYMLKNGFKTPLELKNYLSDKWEKIAEQDRAKTESVMEGGWASTETQNTVITPKTIAEIIEVLKGFEKSYNTWQANNGLDTEIKIGSPKGSGTYYRRDLEQDPTREYGDVDVECFIHSREGVSTAPRITEYRKSIQAYCSQSPDFSTDNGTNIIMHTSDGPVQVDLIYTYHEHADWSRALSPEYRVKGVISTSLTSALAEVLNLSFSSQGIQVKIRNNQPVSFRQSKDTELRTVSTSPETWAQDIYSLYYYLSNGDKPAEMPRSLKAHGGLKDEQRLSDIVLAIKALAGSLEDAGLLGHGSLISIHDKQDLVRKVATVYSNKLETAENSSKFDKAQTPAAVEKAKKTKLMLAKYRNEVTKLLLN